MLHEKALGAAAAMSPSAGPQLDFSGRWINQMDSTMDLAVNGSDVTDAIQARRAAPEGPLLDR